MEERSGKLHDEKCQKEIWLKDTMELQKKGNDAEVKQYEKRLKFNTARSESDRTKE